MRRHPASLFPSRPEYSRPTRSQPRRFQPQRFQKDHRRLQRQQQPVYRFDAHAGIVVPRQRIQHRLQHVRIVRRAVQRLQRLQTNRGIVIVSRGLAKRFADLRIGSIHAQHVQRIQAHARIELLRMPDHIGKHAANLRVIRGTLHQHGMRRQHLHFHARSFAILLRLNAHPFHAHGFQFLIADARRRRHRHQRLARQRQRGFRIPRAPSQPQQRAGKQQRRRAPARMHGQRATQHRAPARHRQHSSPARSRRILFRFIQRLGQFAPATRQQQPRTVDAFRGLIFHQRVAQLDLVFQHARARRAFARMRLHRRAFRVVQLARGIQHRQRFKLVALTLKLVVLEGCRHQVYRTPCNCARSLRVARNSEFLTVSSEVPRASPITRSRRP